MLNEALNKVIVEGILSEIDIEEGTYIKDGKTVEKVSGNIKIRVQQEVNKEIKVLEVPVNLFANKYTKAGTENPAYTAIKKIPTDFKSIAAVGNDVEADRVSITCKININTFIADDGSVINQPRLTGSFLYSRKKDKFAPQANFEAYFVVADKQYEVDKEGVETGRYTVKGIMPIFGGKVQVVNFVATAPRAIATIDEYWNNGDTVSCCGVLDFTSITETYTPEVDFGEAAPKTRTVNIRDFVITGGSQTPLEGDLAYDINEINDAVTVMKAEVEDKKAKKGQSKQRPAPAKPSLEGLGF